MDRLHEDAARFIRQRLLALEEGRGDDADLLENFIEEEFGVRLADVDVAHVREKNVVLYGRWVELGLGPNVEQVSVMVNWAREPVWRMPKDLKDREPSWYEVPLAYVPQDPFNPDDFSKAPENLRPRLEDSGPLPDEILQAIRLPDL